MKTLDQISNFYEFKDKAHIGQILLKYNDNSFEEFKLGAIKDNDEFLKEYNKMLKIKSFLIFSPNPEELKKAFNKSPN